MQTTAQKVIITGRVQGVYYRVHLQAVAQAQNLVGWCRNRPDGSVEAWLQGEPTAVDIVMRWCRTGPPQAQVSEVIAIAVGVEPLLTTFEIRR
jgi:acylphosphatase